MIIVRSGRSSSSVMFESCVAGGGNEGFARADGGGCAGRGAGRRGPWPCNVAGRRTAGGATRGGAGLATGGIPRETGGCGRPRVTDGYGCACVLRWIVAGGCGGGTFGPLPCGAGIRACGRATEGGGAASGFGREGIPAVGRAIEGWRCGGGWSAWPGGRCCESGAGRGCDACGFDTGAARVACESFAEGGGCGRDAGAGEPPRGTIGPAFGRGGPRPIAVAVPGRGAPRPPPGLRGGGSWPRCMIIVGSSSSPRLGARGFGRGRFSPSSP